jgi:hypothetical protein
VDLSVSEYGPVTISFEKEVLFFGSDAAQSGRSLPTFRRNVPPSSSELTSNPTRCKQYTIPYKVGISDRARETFTFLNGHKLSRFSRRQAFKL